MKIEDNTCVCVCVCKVKLSDWNVGWNAWTVVSQTGMRPNPITEYSDRYPLPSRGLMAA